ncbi:MAG: hypothetical protein FJ123_01225 [Deltaproteobacteria bacterium]|nr:hypothetical protein [Deltaproteobacteria bacterium]MBM4350406.1 hypothetical protein [Deltaproteobacteria bacterium]
MHGLCGRGLSEVFIKGLKELGVPESAVVASEAYLPKDTDFSVQLTKIKGLRDDALFIAGHYREGALITRQSKELGLDAQILGTDDIGHPEYIKVAGKAKVQEGHYDTTPDGQPIIGGASGIEAGRF